MSSKSQCFKRSLSERLYEEFFWIVPDKFCLKAYKKCRPQSDILCIISVKECRVCMYVLNSFGGSPSRLINHLHQTACSILQWMLLCRGAQLTVFIPVATFNEVITLVDI